MVKKDIAKIIINKNRGWRGLSEIKILNEENVEVSKSIFSFSQDVWDDLIINHTIVVQDENFYYTIHFGDTGHLPTVDQQRSVLIKNFSATVTAVNKFRKDEWSGKADGNIWAAIRHFIKNENNHTKSDWNCIGIRVVPEI